MKTKMYLHESPFFKKSLARISRLVLMSNPDYIRNFLSLGKDDVGPAGFSKTSAMAI